VSDDAKPPSQAPDDKTPGPPPPPARPAFASGLPQREELRTPRTIAAAHITVVASAIAFLVPSALAVTRWEHLRESLRKSLTEKADDYSAEDIRHAVDVTLIGVGVIALFLLALEIAAVRSLANRQPSGRTMLMILTILHLPLMVIVSAFRDGGLADLAWTAGQAFFLVLTLTMATVHPTKRWLNAKPPIASRTLTSFGGVAPDRSD
jgi:hypothetical protein